MPNVDTKPERVAKAPKAKKSAISRTTIFVGIMAVVIGICVLAFFAPSPDPKKSTGFEDIMKLAKLSEQLLEQGDREAAIEVFDQAISLSQEKERDIPEFHYNKAVTLVEMHRHQEAIDELYLTLDLIKTKGDPKRADTHINLAIAHKQAGNLTGSIIHWKQAAKMRPKRGDLAFSAGNALKESGELKEALHYFDLAIKADQNSPKFLFAAAQLQRQLGYADEITIPLSEKALSVGKASDHFEVGVWLADEEPYAALSHFRRFFDIDPRHPSVRSALYHMTRIYNNIGAANASEELLDMAIEKRIWHDRRQRPGILLPQLVPSAPFPWSNITDLLSEPISLLENNFEAIKKEVLALVELESTNDKRYVELRVDRENISSTEGTWRQAVFARNGIPYSRTFKEFPVTGSILNNFLEKYADRMPKASMELSVLAPGSHLKPHCGPINYRLRLHLALVVPEGASITCGGENKSWTEGKVLVIDDSFEHEVWNNGTTPRAILLVDVWHPLLDDEARNEVRQGMGWTRRSPPESLYH